MFLNLDTRTTLVPTKSNAKTALAAMQWISVIFTNSTRYRYPD
jgi:hypothetical protein